MPIGLDSLGPAQIAALIVLLQRSLEDLYSSRNYKRLIAGGAHEVGQSYYPLMATVQLSWLASVFLLIPPSAQISYPIIAAYIALQVVRYWSIAALGSLWTYRVVTKDGLPIVGSGPFRYVRHPNYLVMIAETFLLPAAFGAWALAIIMATIETAAVRYKIILEDEALEPRRRASAAP